jgi:hypothetical protein
MVAPVFLENPLNFRVRKGESKFREGGRHMLGSNLKQGFFPVGSSVTQTATTSLDDWRKTWFLRARKNQQAPQHSCMALVLTAKCMYGIAPGKPQTHSLVVSLARQMDMHTSGAPMTLNGKTPGAGLS